MGVGGGCRGVQKLRIPFFKVNIVEFYLMSECIKYQILSIYLKEWVLEMVFAFLFSFSLILNLNERDLKFV